MYISSHWLARRIGTEFGESNKCYFDRSVEGHQRKSNWRNDAIALRTLEKFHKGLKNRILLFWKSAFLKYLTIFTVKNIWWSPFSVMVQSASLVKKNSFTSVLSDCLKKTNKWQRMPTSCAASYIEWQQVIATGTAKNNKWQRVVQWMITSDKEWQPVKTNDNEWCNDWRRVILLCQCDPQCVPKMCLKILCRSLFLKNFVGLSLYQ